MADNGADGMPQKLLVLIKAHYSSTKRKVRASGSDSMPVEIRSGVPKDVLSPLPSSITLSTGFLARLYEITHGYRLEGVVIWP